MAQASAPAPILSLPRASWRRWAYLVSGVSSLLFLLYAAAGTQVSYAPAGAKTAPGFVLTLAALVFYGALLSGIVANLLLALGVARAQYRLLLLTALVSACYCGALLGLSTLVTSVRLRAGFLEPLWVWQLLLYQALVLLSAWEHTPPTAVRLPARLLHALQRGRQLQRLHQAARAFTRAFTTGSDE